MNYKPLRPPKAKAITGLSESTIYARITEGAIFDCITTSPRFVVWMGSNIQDWIALKVLVERGNTPLFYASPLTRFTIDQFPGLICALARLAVASSSMKRR
jgi:predicted DNA-binding transcriptional regulator AlpA